ncbi:hypothetical protein PPL_10456 [Heterostelium album PN500]|uniref:Follistatin-like domain-containing protein n=1 Tax=Heterostelium pallidum (strain ATCC 26659 / Pp 5 / PN500) TaxID=670386 RepID=D3BR52_HETP5|nr:hypothetical protein PPL_10456 [Heterostelium album PN500]EFA75884.1 hypothetical protein PPL_10456 [Heterostelium album PN500]|eukprot:XP_020428018.1 hypothetical protein PPL_10456 [Heterostelium album PN500]
MRLFASLLLVLLVAAINVSGQGACLNSKCPVGFYCEDVGGTATCKPSSSSAGQPATDAGVEITCLNLRCKAYETCQMENGKPVCKASGQTSSSGTSGGGCQKEGDCGYGYWCDTNDHQCKPWSSSSSSSGQSSSSGSSGTSGGCQNDAQCGWGKWCDTSDGQCKPWSTSGSTSGQTSSSGSSSGGCQNDEQCGWGKWCDHIDGKCKPWSPTSSSSGQTSSSGTSGVQCQKDVDCGWGKWCDTATGQCKPWSTSGSTSGQTSSSGSSSSSSSSSSSGGSSCANFKCFDGLICVVQNGVPTCVHASSTSGQTSSSGSSSSSSSSGGCQNDAQCGWGKWCDLYSGQCKPWSTSGQTSSSGSSSGHDKCWGYHCEQRGDKGACVPDNNNHCSDVMSQSKLSLLKQNETSNKDINNNNINNNDSNNNSNSKILQYHLSYSYFLISQVLNRIEHRSKLHLPTNFQDVQTLSEILSQYTDDNYFIVMSTFGFIYIFLQAFSIPGSIFLSFLSGGLFGLWVGFPLVCLVATIGAVCSYLISFHISSPLLEVPVSTFAFGTFIGIMPATFLAVKAGLAIQEISKPGDIFDAKSIASMGLLAILSILPTLEPVRRRLDQIINRNNNATTITNNNNNNNNINNTNNNKTKLS